MLKSMQLYKTTEAEKKKTWECQTEHLKTQIHKPEQKLFFQDLLLLWARHFDLAWQQKCWGSLWCRQLGRKRRSGLMLSKQRSGGIAVQ